MTRYFRFCSICYLFLFLTSCAGSRHTDSVSVPDALIHEDQIFSNLSFDEIPLLDSLHASGSSRQIMKKAQQRLDVALDAFQRGDTSATKIVVDDILGLMVVLSDINDPGVAQERDTMLKRVSSLIDNLQANHQRSSVRKGEIPNLTDERIERQIRWFIQKNPRGLRVAYARSGRYGDMIRRELALRGLPGELQWMPVIESAYHPLAYSWANAAGLWQFIPETGKRYGLSRNSWVDDRMDPFKASQAASAYLNDLYDLFGDWLLAIAAYNCGEARVLKAINRYGTNDYWKLKLPKETLDYVPRFLAVVAIIENPERYGFTLPEPLAPYVFEEARIEKSIALSDAAQVIGISSDQLKALNTGLRNGVIPPGGYDLRVPLGSSAPLLARLSDIPESRYAPAAATTAAKAYKVKRGDSLARIASRYGTTAAVLKNLNNLRRGKLKVGQTLQLPGKVVDAPLLASTTPKKAKAPRPQAVDSPLVASSERTYKVKRGDTLFRIAQQHGFTVEALKEANKLKSIALKTGQKLTIPGTVSSPSELLATRESVTETPTPKRVVTVSETERSPKAAASTYKIRSGDTLMKIADRHGVTLAALKKANPRVKPKRLSTGQKLVIPGGGRFSIAAASPTPASSAGNSPESVSVAIVNPGTNPAAATPTAVSSLEPSVHVVRQGESIWSIAREYGLTVVDVLKLNQMSRGGTLLPGQILKLATGSGSQPRSGQGPSVSTQAITSPPR